MPKALQESGCAAPVCIAVSLQVASATRDRQGEHKGAIQRRWRLQSTKHGCERARIPRSSFNPSSRQRRMRQQSTQRPYIVSGPPAQMCSNLGRRARARALCMIGRARASKCKRGDAQERLVSQIRLNTTVGTSLVTKWQHLSGWERTHTTWPSKASATWSTIGAIMRQGPHHGAQKSTNTGRELSSTISWNVLSVTSIAARCRPRSRHWRRVEARRRYARGSQAPLVEMGRGAAWTHLTAGARAFAPLAEAAGSVARASTARAEVPARGARTHGRAAAVAERLAQRSVVAGIVSTPLQSG